MRFFDEHGHSIDCARWLGIYEPQYFLNVPTTKRINQGSRFVEDEVSSLLRKDAPLCEDDLKLLMAWKIGAINHRASENAQNILYYSGWETETKFRYHRFAESIRYLAKEMFSIAAEIDHGNPEYLFALHHHLQGFGPVHIIAVLFFVTHGRYPIYDRFAQVAAQAIHKGLPPGSYVDFKPLQWWEDYNEYINLVSAIAEVLCPQEKISSMIIPRRVDRALWVYGHFFETKSAMIQSRDTTVSIAPEMASPEVLVGKIRDLVQYAGNGWRRREIIVKQRNYGYPAIGQNIKLLDSSGIVLGAFSFIKGANRKGYTCLGQPGRLRAWFEQHYPTDRVIPDTVYLRQTEGQHQYQLYSESQWKMSMHTSQKYRDFWLGFLEFLREHSAPFSFPAPREQYYLDMPIGIKGVKLQPLIGFRAKHIGIDLYAIDAVSMGAFEELHEKHTVVEEEFGEQLDWHCTAKGYVIGLRAKLDPSDNHHRTAQYEWLLDHLMRFREVFVRRINMALGSQ